MSDEDEEMCSDCFKGVECNCAKDYEDYNYRKYYKNYSMLKYQISKADIINKEPSVKTKSLEELYYSIYKYRLYEQLNIKRKFTYKNSGITYVGYAHVSFVDEFDERKITNMLTHDNIYNDTSDLDDLIDLKSNSAETGSNAIGIESEDKDMKESRNKKSRVYHLYIKYGECSFRCDKTKANVANFHPDYDDKFVAKDPNHQYDAIITPIMYSNRFSFSYIKPHLGSSHGDSVKYSIHEKSVLLEFDNFSTFLTGHFILPRNLTTRTVSAWRYFYRDYIKSITLSATKMINDIVDIVLSFIFPLNDDFLLTDLTLKKSDIE